MLVIVAYALVAVSWIVTVLVIIRKNSGKESFLLRVFQNNKDLDTTLNILLRGGVVFATLAILVIFFSMFHDDLDKSDVGMLGMHVISMTGQALTLVSVVNGHSKGKGEKDDDPSQKG